MLTETELERINNTLKEKWGGRPLFRVVYSENELELRAQGDKIWRFRKYPSFRHCYILERDVIEQGCPPELKDWNGYEIIWPFQKPETNEPIDPNLEVCLFITNTMMNGVARTLKDHYDEEKKEFDREVQQTYEMLDDESPYIAGMLHTGSAIVVPDLKKDK